MNVSSNANPGNSITEFIYFNNNGNYSKKGERSVINKILNDGELNYFTVIMTNPETRYYQFSINGATVPHLYILQFYPYFINDNL